MRLQSAFALLAVAAVTSATIITTLTANSSIAAIHRGDDTSASNGEMAEDAVNNVASGVCPHGGRHPDGAPYTTKPPPVSTIPNEKRQDLAAGSVTSTLITQIQNEERQDLSVLLSDIFQNASIESQADAGTPYRRALSTITFDPAATVTSTFFSVVTTPISDVPKSDSTSSHLCATDGKLITCPTLSSTLTPTAVRQQSVETSSFCATNGELVTCSTPSSSLTKYGNDVIYTTATTTVTQTLSRVNATGSVQMTTITDDPIYPWSTLIVPASDVTDKNRTGTGIDTNTYLNISTFSASLPYSLTYVSSSGSGTTTSTKISMPSATAVTSASSDSLGFGFAVATTKDVGGNQTSQAPSLADAPGTTQVIGAAVVLSLVCAAAFVL